jgi:predicted metalloprotease with PDZ domain
LAQVLTYPVDTRGKPSTLRFVNVPRTWKTAVTLEEKGGAFKAESYDRLVDTPVHLSEFEETSFEHGGRRIRIVLHSPAEEHSLEELRQEAEQIVAAATDLMGDAPFPSYTFVYHFADDGGGGMEYRNGTSIYAPAKCRNCGVAELTAHEFFHLWNVKRIRPRSLEPVDFTQPNVTPSLWFSEGVTSTYGVFLRLRSGLLSREKFLEHLTRLIYDYESRPASREQSAEESSIEAWLERYPDYGRSDRSVSYYLKGEIIGYLLDLLIRHKTANQRSLDDVMRLLNREYAQQGRAFEDTEAIERAVSGVVGSDVSSAFHDLVRSAAPIDWNRYLGFAGYRLQPRQQDRLEVGLQLTNVLGVGVIVSAVEAGTPAEEAGFRAGDQVLRLDGRDVVSASAGNQGFSEAAGGAVLVVIQRDGALQALSIRPRTTRDTFYRMIEVERASAPQLAVRRGWLQRETDPPGALLRKKKAGRANQAAGRP